MRTIFYIAILFFCSSLLLRAQTSKIDSLKQVLKHAKNDTATVGTINALTYLLYLNDAAKDNELELYIDSAIRTAQRCNYTTGNIKARFIAGNIFKNTGKTPKAKQYLLSALPLCQITQQPSDYFKINHTLGLCNEEEGNYKLAAEYFYEALRYAEQSGNKTQMGNACGGLGNLYASQGDYVKAISYHLKGLKYRLELGDKMRMSFSYVNLGNAYRNLNKFDSAQHYYNKALIIQTAEKNTVGQAYSYTGIGHIYLMKKLPLASIDYFKRAYALLQTSDDAEVRSWLLNVMGESYLMLNQYDKALQFLNEAMAFNLQTNRLNDLKESYNLLAKTYRAKKDLVNAYDYLEKYSELKDTLLSADVGKKISSMEHNYQAEQEKKIAQLENEKVQFRHDEEVKKQRFIILGVLFILSIVSLFSVFIFKQYRAKKVANAIIQDQKTEIEKQHSELEEKQKEIIDSIRYAKRIQKALMPTEKYIDRSLKRAIKNEETYQ